ncbi:MAG: diguanylate cyclase [Gammaproteobacteria bacterium]
MKRPRLSKLLTQPINRLLVASFLLVAAVPVAVLSVTVYHAAWQDAWREIREKHQLLAQNLTAPISIYVNDHRSDLSLVASGLEQIKSSPAVHGAELRVLDQALTELPGFRSLTVVDRTGTVEVTTDRHPAQLLGAGAFAREQCFARTRADGKDCVSGIERSPLSGKPTLILSRPLTRQAAGTGAVLLAELRVSVIEKLRENIHFGKRGHSAIVDQYGHVIAHPNPAWMAQMKDISSWPVVQKMMAGKTGVTQFYSPFVGQQMVAGYASVPGLGWGVMVPQPKSEVARHVSSLVDDQFLWALGGLGLAVLLGVALARWITRPLNHLADGATDLVRRGFQGRLPPLSDLAPKEIGQLSRAITNLINGLQDSRERHDELNRSLQVRVNEATRELRDANIQLEELCRIDHLTALSNRRFFEHSLSASVGRRSDDQQPLCLMLIDVDHFKRINDTHGHAAGDAVLMQLAALLNRNMRQGDLAARYGGDEFVVKMNCDEATGRQRAKELLEAIRDCDFQWQGEVIHVTVSIGLLFRSPGQKVDISKLLQSTDSAMYKAKEEGRGTVVEAKAAS